MQQEFRCPMGGRFQTPKVIKFDDEQIIMEEVPNALNAAEFLSRYNRNAKTEIHILVEFIKSNIDGYMVFDKAPFIQKILTIIRRLKNVDDIRLCERVATLLDGTTQRLYVGNYHGDLTFANILYPGRYLIDFTPSYIDSPVMDIVKLKQEYKLGWTWHVSKSANIHFMEYMRICELLRVEVDNAFPDDTSLLEAMNLLRILPYCKDSSIRNLIRSSIQNMLW